MTTPTIAQKSPYAVPVVAGETYFWCSCGQSKNQPFCDGSHKVASFTPMAFVAEKTGEAWLCGCKHSKSQPFCDGSHKSL